MNIVNFPPDYNVVGASGVCPHCKVNSYFRPVTTAYEDEAYRGKRIISAVQCESCKRYALVIGWRPSGATEFRLENVFPVGSPDDRVAPEVPAKVSADFAEALRCKWVNSSKAAVVMCRRAVQTSAIELGAAGSKLIDQIDDLFKKGKITESLKDFAHEVRLTGNIGAHPDDLEDVGDKDAADVILFTLEFLDHVYVLPAKLKARKASPAAPAAVSSIPKKP